MAARVAQVLELTDDTEEQRALQLQLVEINELYLGDPDEAIASYSLRWKPMPKHGLLERLGPSCDRRNGGLSCCSC